MMKQRNGGRLRPSRISGTETKTIILFFNDLGGQTLGHEGLELPPGCIVTQDRRLMQEATAVVFHIPTLRDLGRLEKRHGQPWVAWWMEPEVHFPQLQDPEFMGRFDLTMSHHRDADIVSPYYSPRLERLLRTPARVKQPGKLAAWFVSGLYDRSGRTEFVAELKRHMDVHIYGKRFRNLPHFATREIPNDKGRETKLDVSADYKFTLTLENAISKDYVTEKLYDALIAGSVPVYLGAPEIDEYLPAAHCCIKVTDFPTPRDLAECLSALDADEEAYCKYLAWKDRPFRPGFLKMLAAVNEDTLVRLCRRVQAHVCGNGDPVGPRRRR